MCINLLIKFVVLSDLEADISIIYQYFKMAAIKSKTAEEMVTIKNYKPNN